MHSSLYDALVARIKTAYGSVRIGNPLDAGTLVGPLIDKLAFDGMQTALANARKDGATITGGERVLQEAGADSYYVRPAIAEVTHQSDTVCHETFAPILYVMKYESLDEAFRLQNAVPQGLSSAIFTLDVREAEQFLAASGSDCGIANVNIGTSGAEIGGRVWRRKGNRRRTRVRIGLVESLHAPHDQHDQLFDCAAIGAGDQVRRVVSSPSGSLRQPDLREIGETPLLARRLGHFWPERRASASAFCIGYF